jgi:beta-lactamase regulating signal transducer with metallopeptidase domain
MSIINILGESAVRSLALALAVAIVLRVLRVQHARLAKRAWTAVLILSLAMPALVALHIPSFSFTALWSTPRTLVVNAPAPSVFSANATRLHPVNNSSFTAMAAQPEDLAPTVTPSVPVPVGLQGPPQGASVPARHIAWWQIGFATYLAISLLLLLRVGLGLALAARLWRRAQPFAISETHLPGQPSGRLSVRLSVDLRSPATVGHGILLPLEAIGWDDAALSATLAHEEKHVREGDFYLQLAATIHHCFFWISPHAWWLRPHLSHLSETICDHAAIASSGDGLSYAELLIRFATAEQTPAGMVAMAQSAGLRERIDRLIADPELTGAFRHRRGQAIVAATLFAAAAIVTAATVHFVQPTAIVLAAPQAPAAPSQAPSTPDAAPAPQAAPTPDAAPQAPGAGAGTGVGTGDGTGAGDSFAPPAPPADVAPAPDAAPVPPVPPSDAVIASGDHVVLSVTPDVAPVIAVDPVTAVHSIVAMNGNVNVDALSQIEITSPDGERSRGYIIFGPDADHTVMQGSFGDSDTLNLKEEQAKHPGGAIFFKSDGKTWVIDNPALVKQAQDAYAHSSELGKQQGELGAKQGELGARQGELGAIQGELGARQGDWGAMQGKFASDFHFEMPKDFDKTVQEFADSETKLALKSDKMSAEQRSALEAQNKEFRERFEKAMAQFKAQEPQREAMEKQMRDQAEQMRKQMEPLEKQMRDLGEKQGELGRLQGELGRQQGELGRQQAAASREANRKVQSLIDQAVKNGSAHPVQ